MRFLFVGRFPEVGGSALATLPLIEALRQTGQTAQLVHWVIPRQTNWFASRDLLNLEVARQSNVLSKICCLARLAGDYDIIVSVSELTPTYACQIAGWLVERPVYGELQVPLDHWIRQNSFWLHHQLIRWFYPRLNGLRCVSRDLLTYAVEALGVNPDRVFLIYNGFDIQRLKAQAQAPLSAEVRPWFAENTILCVGRLSVEKRFDLAIQAFALAQSQLPSSTQLVIVGDGPLQRDLQSLIDALKLQDRVHLAGLQTNPFPFFAQATIFLLSSDYEGFGRVLVEAMACGCPVIAHNCPVGPAEVLDHGTCGLLLDNNQPPTLADAMVRLLQDDRLRDQLRQQGLSRSRQFDQAEVSQRYLEELCDRIPGFPVPASQ